MQDKSTELLLNSYKAIFCKKNSPDWAVINRKTECAITPSIPFVGKDYFSSSTKIAVYASAENLIYYTKSENDNELLETEYAWNRHRAAFDCWKNSEKKSFFPQVHIAPVEKGGLICALLLLHNLLNLKWEDVPQDLMEKTVVANVGKYSVASTTNIDYAGNFDKLEWSIPYFKIDLEILKPDVLVLPHRIYRHHNIQYLIKEAIPKARIIPVIQCNVRNLNTHLRKFQDQATRLKQEYEKSFPLLINWTNELNHSLRRNIFRYFAHIKSVAE